MLKFYQNLPQEIDPVFFSVGSFSVYWYSMMYVVGFTVIITLLYWRVYKKETEILWGDILDFLLDSFLAVIIGGRIGYVLFYNLSYFLANPSEIIFPFSKDGAFTGIYGMSYHGGVLGFILATYLFCKKRKINFLKLTDFVLPAIPLGYFFGRVGNFLNGELYGRVTTAKWGMYFTEGVLRHPSQLYEAFFEGIVLFLLLWLLRNKLAKKTGMLSGLYISSYGLVRLIIEFFREPDSQIGFVFGFLTMGQMLSLIMIVGGLFIINKNLNYSVKKYGK